MPRKFASVPNLSKNHSCRTISRSSISQRISLGAGCLICKYYIVILNALQKMFMMLGRAEKAGSGVDKILSGWNDLGWSTPVLTEELQPDYVVLTLPVGKAKTHQENPSRKPIKKL